ncbi:MAG: Aspartyl/glutamyl-tRNA(Asn/Gln) amidotransferase subunit C [Candidatus Curtissbacteria bacterium GW2011_GWA1_40_9]|uniref:Aspartyl/glutamyl-tRNA(Asn/Gln) amidotransferase subunit C n=1 Tax=Candidatus Curtissbacteria bacterium GW2011_GWA1_40_9 TaxID=1618408 RepID=A0A0G0TM89_9BACT|nr:MAG: Aspartyl/glutamyl-tRNA(Asn/Gln) amidotransferase subunit C [Candidatus Curtissbacteria bacterium GW2011_GWA1_40_9]
MPNAKSKKTKAKIDITHVAKLANLALTDREKKVFAGQLSETIKYIDKLEELDTSALEPTSQVTSLENVTREDKASSSFSQEDALKNAKSTSKGFIMTKAILEEQ